MEIKCSSVQGVQTWHDERCREEDGVLAIADPHIVLLPLVTERLSAGTIFAGPTPTSSTKPSLLPPPSAPFDGPAIIT